MNMTYLLGVLEVLEKGVLAPCNALVDVGGGVGVALDLASLTAEETRGKEGRMLASWDGRDGEQSTHPLRLGPTLLGSPAPTVWHCAQRVLKRPAPFPRSPEIHIYMSVAAVNHVPFALARVKEDQREERTCSVRHV